MEDVSPLNFSTLKTEIFRYLPLGSFLGLVFIVVLFFIVKENSVSLNHSTNNLEFKSWIMLMDGAGASTSNLESLGQLLYTY